MYVYGAWLVPDFDLKFKESGISLMPDFIFWFHSKFFLLNLIIGRILLITSKNHNTINKFKKKKLKSEIISNLLLLAFNDMPCSINHLLQL